MRHSGASGRTPCSCGTHSGSSPFLCLLEVNGGTIGSPPEGWPVFAACVFVLHQMFTQNTPVPLRTRSAHPSNLPCRQRHRVPPGQHLTQRDPLATQRKLLSAAPSQSAAPVSCQTLCTVKLMEAPHDQRLSDLSCPLLNGLIVSNRFRIRIRIILFIPMGNSAPFDQLRTDKRGYKQRFECSYTFLEGRCARQKQQQQPKKAQNGSRVTR